jgi:hypothetical protein
MLLIFCQLHADKFIPGYKGIFNSAATRIPTAFTPDAPIAGNGDVGIVLGGTPGKLCIYISKADFWKARRGYPEGGLCLPGGLNISVPELEGAAFYAEQWLSDASIHGVFRNNGLTFRMTVTVVADRNIILTELSAEGKSCRINLDLWAKSGFDSRTETGEQEGIRWAARHFETPELDWPSHVVMAMKAIGTESSGTSLDLKPGSPVTLVTAICTNHDRPDYFETALRYARETDLKSAASLKKSTASWWVEFWSESEIHLNDTLLEKYYYGSQYLLACCSRNNNFPPGLCGNSITEDAVNAWEGDYHTNYNFQAPFWACFSSNHIGLTDPYDAPILDYLGEAKKHAREILQQRGAYYPVGIGPKGFGSSMYPLTEEKMLKTYGIKDLNLEGGHMFCGQRSNGLFLTINMFQRFYHTYDEAYARKVFPMIREVADFWEDWLKFENGQYNNYNDNFWEVGPWTSGWRQDMLSGDFNNTNTLGLLKMFAKGFIEMSSFLGESETRRSKWVDISDHLYPVPMVNIDGKIRIKAAESGTSSGSESRTKPGFGRVMAYVHGFPGGTTGVKTDPAFARILRDEVGRWGKDPGGDHDWNHLGNGIETFYTTAVRVGFDPDTILVRLKERIAKTALPNLWVPQSGGLTETLSAIPSCINEMLLQGYEGMIRVFPAWPGKDASFENLRTREAFLVTSEKKDGTVRFVDILSEKGRECVLENPWPGRQVRVSSGGREASLEGELLTFKTVAGQVLRVEPLGR